MKAVRAKDIVPGDLIVKRSGSWKFSYDYVNKTFQGDETKDQEMLFIIAAYNFRKRSGIWYVTYDANTGVRNVISQKSLRTYEASQGDEHSGLYVVNAQ